MPTPKIWNEFLDGHVLIISKSNDCEAYLRTQQRLKDRGFTNIVHISLPSVNTLNTNWNEIFNNKSYKFDKDDIEKSIYTTRTCKVTIVGDLQSNITQN